MGRRKPPVPRRRVGIHFVELAARRGFSAPATTHAHAACNAVAASLETPPAGAASLAPVEAPANVVDDMARPVSTLHQLPLSMPACGDYVDGLLPVQHHKHHLQLHSKARVATVPFSTAAQGANPSPRRAEQQHAQPPHTNVGTVTMSVEELEAWQQHTTMAIEDHFTNEQLKRIAEFGRVHANLVKEAKEYVHGIEVQLKEQFERERESLRRQAEEYVLHFQQENARLRQQVLAMAKELEEARSAQQTFERATTDKSVDVDGDDGLLSGEDLRCAQRFADMSHPVGYAVVDELGVLLPLKNDDMTSGAGCREDIDEVAASIVGGNER